jgi:hypothetical protein
MKDIPKADLNPTFGTINPQLFGACFAGRRPLIPYSLSASLQLRILVNVDKTFHSFAVLQILRAFIILSSPAVEPLGSHANTLIPASNRHRPAPPSGVHVTLHREAVALSGVILDLVAFPIDIFKSSAERAKCKCL